MAGIPEDLTRQLHEALKCCSQFGNNVSLRALFVNKRIYIWRNQCPEADDRETRVSMLIDALLDQRDATGRYALPLFLEVLVGCYSPDNALYGELTKLKEELEQVLVKKDNPDNKAEASQNEQSGSTGLVTKPRQQTKNFQFDNVIKSLKSISQDVYKVIKSDPISSFFRRPMVLGVASVVLVFATILLLSLLKLGCFNCNPIIDIESHQNSDVVGFTTAISGTYSHLPDGYQLWGLVEPESGQYWVQGGYPLESGSGTWSIPARFGYADNRSIGEQFKFYAIVIPQDSIAKDYLEVSRGTTIPQIPTEDLLHSPLVITLTRGSPADHWEVNYWATNEILTDPIHTQALSTTYVFLEWWNAPATNLPEHGWTAQAARRVKFPETGEYCFHRVSLNPGQVFVDNEPLELQTSTEKEPLQPWSACVELTAGYHELRVDLSTTADRRVLEFWYDGPGIVPAIGTQGEPWQATFFSTADLNGKPVWSTSLPGQSLSFSQELMGDIPAANFGAVFTNTVMFEEGSYRFTLELDDGGRFKIDDETVLDAWHEGPQKVMIDRYLGAGAHRLQLDYYEYWGRQYAHVDWKKIESVSQPVQRIVFASNQDGNDTEIYIMDADGANPRNLTNNDSWDYDPAWSPDGSRIVFASTRDGEPLLYTMNADGSDVRSLGVTGYQPGWSPDGSRIVYYEGSENAAELYIIDVNSHEKVQLTDNLAADLFPVWSPDGSQIAFETTRDGNPEVYVMNADGSDPVNLSQNPAWDSNPTWSPDSHRIAFASDRDNNREIYVMDADGANPRRLTDAPANDQFPTWSPDGQFLAFERDTQGDKENIRRIYRVDEKGNASPQILTDVFGVHERPKWSPATYGYRINVFTDGDDVNDGVIAITGDSIWTGGNGGILRWDRNNLESPQKFTVQEGLGAHRICSILPDNDHSFWISFCGWPYEENLWNHYAFDPDTGFRPWEGGIKGTGIDAGIVADFYRDSSGNIWAGTDQGAWKYNGEEWMQVAETKGHYVTNILQASDGAYWFKYAGPKVIRYVPLESGDIEWQEFDLLKAMGSENSGFYYASSLLEGKPGEIWVGTNAGVVYYDGESWHHAPEPLDSSYGLTAIRDSEGSLWFAPLNPSELIRLYPNGNVKVYTADDGIEGLVFALALDEKNKLWGGGDGLYQYQPEEDRWKLTVAPDRMMHNHIGAIAQNHDGTYWFGEGNSKYGSSWYGGLIRYAPGQEDDWQALTMNNRSGYHIRTIMPSQNGDLWLGFGEQGGGACDYNPTDGTERCYPADPSGLISDTVNSILQTRDGALWFGTGAGLSRRQGDRWESFALSNFGSVTDRIQCLAEDPNGMVWVSTESGAYRFEDDQKQWTPFTNANTGKGLVADDVVAMTANANGIWFGTSQGLSYYNVNRQNWDNINIEESPKLPGWIPGCAPLLEVDRYGNLWVGTDQGLYRSTPTGGWLHLTTGDGLPSRHILALYEDRDGKLWVGTPNGVAVIEVENKK